MYFNKKSDTLLNFILSDVGDSYTIYIDGLYGIAYNNAKTDLRLYTVEDDTNVVGHFVLDEKAIEDILGVDFFKLCLKDRFSLVEDVLNMYYLNYSGSYTEPYLKSELLKYIKSDAKGSDTILIGYNIGIRYNVYESFLAIYILKIDEGVINISTKYLDTIEDIGLLLGDDFTSSTDSMKIQIVLDYLNSLN